MVFGKNKEVPPQMRVGMEGFDQGEQLTAQEAGKEWNNLTKHLKERQIEVKIIYDNENYVTGVNFFGPGAEKLNDTEREMYENKFKNLQSVIILGK